LYNSDDLCRTPETAPSNPRGSTEPRLTRTDIGNFRTKVRQSGCDYWCWSRRATSQ